MKYRNNGLLFLALLLFYPLAFAKPAPDVCLELGALAWDDWTSSAAGGSGLPAGEPLADYLRCVSCHGWDRLGEDGGSVRKIRSAETPNTGLGDPDITSRNIAPGLGHYYEINADELLHAGTGRSYADGSGSWVELDHLATLEDKVAHSAGFTLGNQHPDFSSTGANAGDITLSQDQLDCLVDFINYADADPKFYFTTVDTTTNPVTYGIHDGASAPAGRTYYTENCRQCHGEPEQDHQGFNNGIPAGGILAFMGSDGSYSELAHKARWGIPGTDMTRSMIGTPDSQDMIDLMLYLQELDEATFSITGGISGTWYNADRNGEGFLIDVAPATGGGWMVVATYYTYDGMGNQVWMIGNALAAGNGVTTPMQVTEGAVFGTMFNLDDVVRTDWGELEFEFSGCESGHVIIRPNAFMLAAGLGFETFEYNIVRVTQAGDCP